MLASSDVNLSATKAWLNHQQFQHNLPIGPNCHRLSFGADIHQITPTPCQEVRLLLTSLCRKHAYMESNWRVDKPNGIPYSPVACVDLVASRLAYSVCFLNGEDDLPL